VQNPTANGSDIVIVTAIRTPIGKAKKGSFKDTHWTELLSFVLKEVAEKSSVPVSDIQDVQVGIVRAPGGGATEARMALLHAGYPVSTCLATTNRQCSSGLQAFVNIAQEIRLGMIKIGVAAGVESMSDSLPYRKSSEVNQKLLSIPLASDCLIPMGITSENVAKIYNLSRSEIDEFALQSQQKAFHALKNNLYEEIVPIPVTVKGEGNQTGIDLIKKVVVSNDEGIRPTTLEALSKLKPAFTENGSTTAGNSSQVSDGAAAVLLMTRSEAEKRGLPILGRFVSYAVAGVPPSLMGIGPALAIPKALEMAGLGISDIDIFEINEAFATQCKYTIDHLKIPSHKVNPLGGAIALGHPLGMTGARLIGTLLHHLRRNRKRYGVVSMCMATGMGAAALFEAESQNNQ